MAHQTDQYVVDLLMPTALQVRDLLMLCHLLEWNLSAAEPTVEIVAANRLRISFWKNKLEEKKWIQVEADFFVGLRLVGLIIGWQVTEEGIGEI